MSSPKTIPELPKTLSELQTSGYRSVSVKDELRGNLIKKLKSGEKLFPGIVGYDETVIPQLVNAILARHNIILLGLRGQAKSRIIRGLTELLDEQIPAIAGSEVNDDPFHPISAYGRQTLELHGDATPITWLGRDSRFVEKLATPDVTIADIIGDVDPIKAAKGGHLLSDELTIHYGLLPRANRGIFAINELPDLAGKIQVGLFNIMQEGDVQIKGYPVRLPLDVMLIFSANPEDYTARGKIITPLKDRIGTEIMTHYPAEIQTAVQITRQEAWVSRTGLDADRFRLHVPDFIRETIEQIAFEARDDTRVDKHSGVSQRMPITVIESVISNGLSVFRQIEVPVWFRGRKIGDFTADMLVEKSVLLELKAGRSLDPAHQAQLLNYLRATEIEVGMLFSFGLKPEFKRLAYDNDRKQGGVRPSLSDTLLSPNQ